MKSTALLFCTIFISLSTAFSANTEGIKRQTAKENAQTKSELSDSLRLQAAICERKAYYAADPVEAGEWLAKKAEILASEGLCSEAAETAGRIALYALDKQRAEELAALQDSLSLIALHSDIDNSAQGDRKSKAASSVLNAGIAAYGVTQALAGNWVSAWICGAGGLYNIWETIQR